MGLLWRVEVVVDARPIRRADTAVEGEPGVCERSQVAVVDDEAGRAVAPWTVATHRLEGAHARSNLPLDVCLAGHVVGVRVQLKLHVEFAIESANHVGAVFAHLADDEHRHRHVDRLYQLDVLVEVVEDEIPEVVGLEVPVVLQVERDTGRLWRRLATESRRAHRTTFGFGSGSAVMSRICSRITSVVSRLSASRCRKRASQSVVSLPSRIAVALSSARRCRSSSW